jgi:hypothetical protein
MAVLCCTLLTSLHLHYHDSCPVCMLRLQSTIAKLMPTPEAHMAVACHASLTTIIIQTHHDMTLCLSAAFAEHHCQADANP